MVRGGRLHRLATLLSTASEVSTAGRAGIGEAAATRRYLSSSTISSHHACQGPIAAGTSRVAARYMDLDHSGAYYPALFSGSPIRGLLRGVSACNTVWARHISAQALQPSDTYEHRLLSAHADIDLSKCSLSCMGGAVYILVKH